MSRYVKGQVGLHDDLGNAVDTLIPRKCQASNRLITPSDHASIQLPICSVDENGVMVPGEHKIVVISGFLRSQGEADHAINHILIGSGVLRGRSSRQPKWLKKRQAEARKKFAAKTTRRGPGGKRGGPGGKRPGGKGGARPQGKRPFGKRPEGKTAGAGAGGARPEGKRPAGKRPEGKQGPRPEGKRPAGKRPEGKAGARPQGKRPTATQAAAAAAN